MAALAVLALALPLAACGSDDDDARRTPRPAARHRPTAAPADSGAADRLRPPTAAPPTRAAGGDVPDGPDITIGAQDFGESTILAEIYGQALENAGYPVSQQALGGFRDIVFASFESGDINFTPSTPRRRSSSSTASPARRPATSTRPSHCCRPSSNRSGSPRSRRRPPSTRTRSSSPPRRPRSSGSRTSATSPPT